MAKIVLGVATSHGPMLSTPPEEWGQRLPADKSNPAHSYQGGTYTFEELVDLRKNEALGNQVSQAIWERKYDRFRSAIDQLADVWERVRPDVAVIFGNDQMELFNQENIPAFAVFAGEAIHNTEYDDHQMASLPPGIAVSVPGHIPPGGACYSGKSDLALHIASSLTRDAFDVSVLRQFPERHDTIPHAFGFVYRQIMRDRVVPSVPLFVNTFYAPNQPPAARCRRFGQSVLRAIREWPVDLRVALIASGGLSHFVIDENLDGLVMDALRSGSIDALDAIPETFYQSGSSEIKNWIPLAGAMADLKWPAQIVDYVPCYRSEAGTGNAMGFAYWEPKGQ